MYTVSPMYAPRALSRGPSGTRRGVVDSAIQLAPGKTGDLDAQRVSCATDSAVAHAIPVRRIEQLHLPYPATASCAGHFPAYYGLGHGELFNEILRRENPPLSLSPSLSRETDRGIRFSRHRNTGIAKIMRDREKKKHKLVFPHIYITCIIIGAFSKLHLCVFSIVEN